MAVAAVSGAAGMLGSAVVWALKDAGYWVDALPRYGTSLRPDTALVVHCAAKTDAAACERDFHGTVHANATWPGELASKATDARFIHISTVAVYDPSLSGPHVETERYVPSGAYAASKLEGEQAVLAAHPAATVIRPMIFGRAANGSRPKLADKILAALHAGRPMRLWINQWSNPLYVGDLADIIVGLAEVDAPGPLNVGSVDPISQYEFGRMLAAELGLDDLCLVRGRLAQAENLTVHSRRLAELEAVEPAPAVVNTLARFHRAQ